jgi:hypothetical protein
MQTDCVNAASVTAWVVVAGALGYVSGAASFAGWSLLPVVSLATAALVVRLWSLPSPSMSEAIREELR